MGVVVINQFADSGGDGDVSIGPGVITNIGLPAIEVTSSLSVSNAAIGDVYNVTVHGVVVRNPLFNLGASLASIYGAYVRGFNVNNNNVWDVPENQAGIYCTVCDLFTASANQVVQTKPGLLGDVGLWVRDSTRVNVTSNTVFGIGNTGIRIEAGSLGSTDKVTLSNNLADSNGTNFYYAGGTPPGTFITNLTRNGNINDNLSVIGGTSSRILDSIPGSSGTTFTTFPANDEVPVTVPWSISPINTNYAPSCSVQQDTVGPNTLRLLINSPLNVDNVTVRVRNDGTADRRGIVHCVAVFKKVP